MKQKVKVFFLIVDGIVFLIASAIQGQYLMERLDRGLIAVRINNGYYVSWRLLGTDSTDIGFNLYRGSQKLNASPIVDSTNYIDNGAPSNSSYTVRPVMNGQEGPASKPARILSTNYLQVPVQRPPGPYVSPAGYTAGDVSVGDLDGDGEYEIVLKWEDLPKDNSQGDITNTVILDAYKMDGTLMWRIDLGINIREGAHYTQFMVYDLDGDGKAEVACKTADGTVDGAGTVIGDANADYRNASGYILKGPEFLTIFDGEIGKALSTTDYIPPRHPTTVNPTPQPISIPPPLQRLSPPIPTRSPSDSTGVDFALQCQVCDGTISSRYTAVPIEQGDRACTLRGIRDVSSGCKNPSEQRCSLAVVFEDGAPGVPDMNPLFRIEGIHELSSG